ncbi:MAG: ABC transporter ATP-binding protein [Eubacterium sp.]|nr:ABC transporter ATP-binding protein [Eubacterium sp.]
MGEYAIEVDHLTKTYKLYQNNKRRIIEGLFPKVKPQYKEFHALNDVCFRIRKGEIVGIIGKNGSGKSTLLKIITGVLNSSNGSVFVNGKISALLELGAGFNPEYTGVENIYLNGTLNKMTREEMGRRIDEIADFADIGDFIHQPVKNYSSGMFVRLAFSVAVYSDPDILIVDEALAVGDAAFQAKCMARMNQIMKSGATVLFVTHDMNTVKQLCQRCIYLENGRKIMEGPAADLADLYLKRIRASMNEEHMKVETSSDRKQRCMSQPETSSDENSVADKNGVLDKMGTENSLQCVPEGNGDKIFSKKDDADMEELCEKLILKYGNHQFMQRTERFREGTGAVQFLDVRLLNEKQEELFSFAYNQKLVIRITLIVKSEETFAVAYHIRDDKNVELLGTSTLRETEKMIHGKIGEIYEIDMVTRLPVIEGNYNLTVLASKPLIRNRTALFLSYIENAAVFSVEENISAKLWDKVYLKNEIIMKKTSLGNVSLYE